MRDEKEIFKPESKITIKGKVYLIHRHFVNNRGFKDAIFAVAKNDATRVLLDISKVKRNS